MSQLTTVEFETTSLTQVALGNRVTVLMDMVTGSDLIADSADVTPEGYRRQTVSKILKSRDTPAEKAPRSKRAFYKWLND